jgi:hypothetical protein
MGGTSDRAECRMWAGWFVAALDGMVKTAGPALVKDWTVGTDQSPSESVFRPVT